MAVDDFNLLHLFVNIPGRMPQVGFASAGASSDDTVGTVNIPVTLALPAGSNSWPANQAVYYVLDPSSTAEYGVDYIATGGDLTFYGGQVPTPQNISLKILPTGQPKNKTVVFRLQPATSIANLGAQTLSSTVASFKALSALELAESAIAIALGQLGADSRALNFQADFIAQLTDSTTEGLGDIVDADMAKESARLQALQVKQQLGVQTLNIANQRPTILQQLFR